jgi:transcriptional regulator GlxA family with amidase domain
LLADEYVNPGVNSYDYTAGLLRALMISLIREAAEPDAELEVIYFQKQYAKQLHPAFDYINEHYTDEIRLDDLAASCNLSTGRFSHVFFLAAGMAPFSYINQFRINKAAVLLQNSQLDLPQVAHTAGFCEYAYFSRTFKKYKGISPIKFRQKNV